MLLRLPLASLLTAPVLLAALLSFRAAPPRAAAGTVTVKLNGKPYTLGLQPYCCARTMGVVNIGAALGSGRLSLAFNLPDNPKLPLTLPLGEPTGANSVFYYPDNAQAGKRFYWSSRGSITVTKYDAATRTLSGSFTCTGQLRQHLKDVPGSTLQLTDGVFTNVSLSN